MNDSVIYYRVYAGHAFVGQFKDIQQARELARQYRRSLVVEWNAASNTERPAEQLTP